MDRGGGWYIVKSFAGILWLCALFVVTSAMAGRNKRLTIHDLPSGVRAHLEKQLNEFDKAYLPTKKPDIEKGKDTSILVIYTYSGKEGDPITVKNRYIPKDDAYIFVQQSKLDERPTVGVIDEKGDLTPNWTSSQREIIEQIKHRSERERKRLLRR